MPAKDTLEQLALVLQSRKPASGGNPQASYVARLLHKGPDAFLKKIGEEATEVVMAAKDVDAAMGKLAASASENLAVSADENLAVFASAKQKLIAEMADLWFHSLIALTHYELSPNDVLAELERRVGVSGLDEKALRKVATREAEDSMKTQP